MNRIEEAQKEERELQLAEVMRDHESLRESLKGDHEIDPDKIDWKRAARKNGFWKTMESTCGVRLREANSSSSLGQLLRYGVQQFMFDDYKDVPTIYPDIVKIVPSSNRQEWYAPLYGAEIPQDVQEGSPANDSRIQGLDISLPNKRVARILSMEQSLFDDDQTGQVAQRASKLGQRMRYKEEFDVMAAVRAATYNTTIGNTGASDVALSQQALETADIALMGIRDPLGNRMMVMPSYLLVDPSNKFAAAKLLKSSLQPSVPGASGETIGDAASGGTGWTMAMNPLQGLYQLGVSRFLGTGDWFLMEPKTSIPFQEREPLSVVQENPQSGKSFENRLFRWRVDRRYNVTVLESRFIYKGKKNATAPTI